LEEFSLKYLFPPFRNIESLLEMLCNKMQSYASFHEATKTLKYISVSEKKLNVDGLDSPADSSP
jgi:hypothetical protein